MTTIKEKIVNTDFWRRNKQNQSSVYKVGSKIYRMARGFFYKALRIYCYTKYNLGIKRVHLKFGRFTAKYEAMSPKNCWLISLVSKWELRFMKDVIFKYVKPGDVCLDIGANVGMYTIPLALRVGPIGQVFAFEPDEQTCNTLLKNISLNNLKNVHAMRVAISNKDGKIPFYCRPDTDQHSTYEKTTVKTPKGQHTITIESARIDTLVSNGTISKPDFIKIDIEGGEIDAIHGLGNTAKYVRAIMVEVHKDRLILAGYANPFDYVINSFKNLASQSLNP